MSSQRQSRPILADELRYFEGRDTEPVDDFPSYHESFDYPTSLETAPTVAYWGPPGTGKTYQLKQNVRDELDAGLGPYDITATSYRTEMARDLSKAVAEETGDYSRWLGTTHAIGRRLIVTARDGDVVTVDADHKAAFCRDLGVPFETENSVELDPDSPYTKRGSLGSIDAENIGELFFRTLSVLKNRGAPYSSWFEWTPMSQSEIDKMFGLAPYPSSEDFRFFDRMWQAWKHARGLVDFEDMLLIPAMSHLTPPTDVLIEDEFQDKSPLQIAAYNVWAGKMKRVYVAGDPYQAIYGFMGTTPRFMREALDTASESVNLEKSYRNPPAVTRSAARILEAGGYEPPTVEGTGEGEVEFIGMSEYRDLALEHEEDRTFHLSRTNYQMKVIRDVLASNGIPFKDRSGMWTDKQADFYNAVARVRQIIGEDIEFGARYDYQDLTYGERDRLAEAVSGHHWDVKKGDYPGFETTHDELGDVLDMRAVLPVIREENPIEALASGDSVFNSSMFNEATTDRLIKTWNRRDGSSIESFDHHVTTIHGSKGREADVVFLFDHTAPRAAFDLYGPLDDAEELLVWYVGLTRTRGDVYVVRSTETPKQALPI